MTHKCECWRLERTYGKPGSKYSNLFPHFSVIHAVHFNKKTNVHIFSAFLKFPRGIKHISFRLGNKNLLYKIVYAKEMRTTFQLAEQMNMVGSSHCFRNHRGLKHIRGIIVVFVFDKEYFHEKKFRAHSNKIRAESLFPVYRIK